MASVNDVFVMDAWGKCPNAGAYCDAGGWQWQIFTRPGGLELDGTGFGMGIRSKRFAMIGRDDGVVTC